MSDCHENACAEGTVECGSASYRLWLRIQGGSFAAALQGASRIFMRSGEPKDHEIFAQDDSASNFSQLQRAEWSEGGSLRRSPLGISDSRFEISD
jgi:hypothetical protein